MNSKGIFIFLGAYGAAAAALFYKGVSIEFIIFISGPVTVILGIALLVKEFNWRRDSACVIAKVSGYHEYTNTNSGNGAHTLMYSMEAEYTTTDGKCIKSREQNGSNHKKYAVGSDLKVKYSRKNPELFIVEGDNSRIYAMIGVIITGLAIALIFGYIVMNGIIIEQ